ncbi:hypothetical protein ALCH109712_03285 [Alkalicoccus chagannorensis]
MNKINHCAKCGHPTLLNQKLCALCDRDEREG